MRFLADLLKSDSEMVMRLELKALTSDLSIRSSVPTYSALMLTSTGMRTLVSSMVTSNAFRARFALAIGV